MCRDRQKLAYLVLRALLLVALLCACSTPSGAQPAPAEGERRPAGSGEAGSAAASGSNAAVDAQRPSPEVPKCAAGSTSASSCAAAPAAPSGSDQQPDPAVSEPSAPAGAAISTVSPTNATNSTVTVEEPQQPQQAPAAGASADAKPAQHPPAGNADAAPAIPEAVRQPATAAAPMSAEGQPLGQQEQQQQQQQQAPAATPAAETVAVPPVQEQQQPPPLPVHEELHNFALAKDGSKVLAANKEAKKVGALLDDDSDTFLKNDCRAEAKWVIVELSQVAKVSRLELSQFELYSARVREFEVLGRQSHPRTDGVGSEYGRGLNSSQWRLMGNFTAEKVKGSQTFVIDSPRWVRYLLLRFLSQHGAEAVCALNGVAAYGRSAVEELEDQLAAEEGLGLLPADLDPAGIAPPAELAASSPATTSTAAAAAAAATGTAADAVPADAAVASAAAAGVPVVPPPAADTAAVQGTVGADAGAREAAEAPQQQEVPPGQSQGAAVVPQAAQQAQQQGQTQGDSSVAGESRDSSEAEPAPPASTTQPTATAAPSGQQQLPDAAGSPGASQDTRTPTPGSGSAGSPQPSSGVTGSPIGEQVAGASKVEGKVESSSSGGIGSTASVATDQQATELPVAQEAATISQGPQPAAAAAAGPAAEAANVSSAVLQAEQALPPVPPPQQAQPPQPQPATPVDAGSAAQADRPAQAAAPAGTDAAPQQVPQKPNTQPAQPQQAPQPVQQPTPSPATSPLPLPPPPQQHHVQAPAPVVRPARGLGSPPVGRAPVTAGSVPAGGTMQPGADVDDILQLPLARLTAKGKSGGSVYELLVQEIKAAKLQHKLLAKSVAEVARNASSLYAELAGDVASLAATLAKLPSDRNSSEEALAAHVDALVKAHLLHVSQQMLGLQLALATAAKQQHALLCFLAMLGGVLALNGTRFAQHWPRAKWAVLLLAAANGLVGVVLQLQGGLMARPAYLLQALPGWAQQ